MTVQELGKTRKFQMLPMNKKLSFFKSQRSQQKGHMRPKKRSVAWGSTHTSTTFPGTSSEHILLDVECDDSDVSPVCQTEAETPKQATTGPAHAVTKVEKVDPLGRTGEYTGTVLTRTNIPHGSGRMEYDRDEQQQQSYFNTNNIEFSITVLTYDGQWVNGDWCGYGKLVVEVQNMASGTIQTVTYSGGFFDNRKHGQGVLSFDDDGGSFDGVFQLDKITKGKINYKDGSSYWGSFTSSQRNETQNKKNKNNDDNYACHHYYDIKEFTPRGRGKLVKTDGTIYDGEFENGIFHGHGRLTLADGGFYLGEWSEGKRSGFGIEATSDGELIHEGIFYDDKPIHGSSFPHKQRMEEQVQLDQEREFNSDTEASSLSSDLSQPVISSSRKDKSQRTVLLFRSSTVLPPQRGGGVKPSTLVGAIPKHVVMRRPMLHRDFP